MSRRTIIIILLFSLISLPLFAKKKSADFNSSFNNIKESVATSPFLSFIGLTADSILIKLQDAIMPGIVRLVRDEGNAIQGDNKITHSLRLPDKDSFVGCLITILLTLECIVLGIKSFIGEQMNAISLLKHLLTLSILLVFIAFLPIIAESVLTIFTSGGVIAGGGEIDTSVPFAFSPSSIINVLSKMKAVLDVSALALGGISITNISNLPSILMVHVASFIVSIPFVIVSVCVIFWYLEFYLIVLLGTITLPFSFFSFSSLTDMKSILKALLLDGIKIFLGVFLATITASVITNEVENLTTSAGSVMNLIIYIFLMTAVFIFGIIKGPSIFMNALKGEASSFNNLSGVALASIGAISAIKSGFNKIHKDLKKSKGDEGTTDQPTESGTDDPRTPEPPEDPKEPSTTNTPSHSTRDKSIGTRVTKKSLEKAYNDFVKEGVTNIDIERADYRARWDNTYKKLEKMEKNKFTNKDGYVDENAKEQLRAMRKERKAYTEGKATFDGESLV